MLTQRTRTQPLPLSAIQVYFQVVRQWARREPSGGISAADDSGNTWATTRIGDRHSVIRAPRSGRILPRRDPIFELVNTVVSEVRKRAFSARS